MTAPMPTHRGPPQFMDGAMDGPASGVTGRGVIAGMFSTPMEGRLSEVRDVVVRRAGLASAVVNVVPRAAFNFAIIRCSNWERVDR